MRESEVEHQFVEAVRAAGGQALKFTSQSMNGVPDRLVLLLGGKCAFVELKAPVSRCGCCSASAGSSLKHWAFRCSA